VQGAHSEATCQERRAAAVEEAAHRCA
jgi:hypothetical protein